MLTSPTSLANKGPKTTVRTTWQGYGLLVLKVIDFSQSAHSLAWGLVSKEDDDAHVFVFQQLVAELNNVVTRCARNGESI